MNGRTINDEITDIVSYEIKNIPFPTECTITKIYEDNHADIESAVYGSLSYVELFGLSEIGDKGILLFLNNELSSPVVVTGVNNSIISRLYETIDDLYNKLEKIEKNNWADKYEWRIH